MQAVSGAVSSKMCGLGCVLICGCTVVSLRSLAVAPGWSASGLGCWEAEVVIAAQAARLPGSAAAALSLELSAADTYCGCNCGCNCG